MKTSTQSLQKAARLSSQDVAVGRASHLRGEQKRRDRVALSRRKQTADRSGGLRLLSVGVALTGCACRGGFLQQVVCLLDTDPGKRGVQVPDREDAYAQASTQAKRGEKRLQRIHERVTENFTTVGLLLGVKHVHPQCHVPGKGPRRPSGPQMTFLSLKVSQSYMDLPRF